MDTLYRFRLDTETGKVEKLVITEYHLVRPGSRDEAYRYRGKSVTNYVKLSNLDRMFCNQVYTFNPSEQHAIEIMMQELTDKIDDIQSQLDRMKGIQAKLRCYKAFRLN